MDAALLLASGLAVGACSSGGGGGGGSGDECARHNQCAFDEFCYASACEAALGRRYTFVIESLSVGTTFPTGGDWDILGGAPDLTVVFGEDGGDQCQTSVASDTFSVTYNESCDFVLGSNFFVDVWDDDATDDDWAAGWFWEGTDGLVSLARSNEQSFTLQTGQIALTMSVWFPTL